jgi:hypothetical protein
MRKIVVANRGMRSCKNNGGESDERGCGGVTFVSFVLLSFGLSFSLASSLQAMPPFPSVPPFPPLR